MSLSHVRQRIRANLWRTNVPGLHPSGEIVPGWMQEVSSAKEKRQIESHHTFVLGGHAKRIEAREPQKAEYSLKIVDASPLLGQQSMEAVDQQLSCRLEMGVALRQGFGAVCIKHEVVAVGAKALGLIPEPVSGFFDHGVCTKLVHILDLVTCSNDADHPQLVQLAKLDKG